MKQSATANLMRSINRSAILDFIRTTSPTSRSQIAHELNMSLPTVMRIIDDLINDNLVHPYGLSQSTGGRPPSLIEFNSQAYAIVGIDLGGTKMFGAVTDLSGNIQHEIYIPHKPNNTPKGYLEELCKLIQKLLDAPRPKGQRIRGIGVGAPSITLVPQGVVTWAPTLGWRDLPLQDILAERFDISVFVDNDVNLAALGEWGFGAGRGAQNLVSIAIGTAIGAGIIIGDTLYRGYHQAAGEVGYLLPGVEFLGRQYNQFGALESLASGSGIANRAQQILKQEQIPLPSEDLTAQFVFEAARKGEPWAKQVLNETIDYLSIAIANVSILFDPEVVILGGGVARSADLLIDPIIQRLKGVMPFMPRLVASPLEQRATVMGAMMMVLNGANEYFVVKRLP
jgi:glucokinase-like ROK family protein